MRPPVRRIRLLVASRDVAKACKESVQAAWTTDHPTWTTTLLVDDDHIPSDDNPTLLVADDGSTRVVGDSWTLRNTPRRRDIRLTAYTKGRSKALQVIEAAVDHLITNRPPDVARFEDAPDPLVTRDRKTGAFLASVTMPALARPE